VWLGAAEKAGEVLPVNQSAVGRLQISPSLLLHGQIHIRGGLWQGDVNGQFLNGYSLSSAFSVASRTHVGTIYFHHLARCHGFEMD